MTTEEIQSAAFGAAELTRAILDGQLTPFFQPIVHLGTGAVVGWEALARWMHPEFGTVLPDDFIPLAEANGLIAGIDELMLIRGLEMLASLDSRAGGSPFVSVNVSACHLGDGTLADTVLTQLHHFGLTGRRLCIEVTETAVMADLDRACAELSVLRSVGVQVAIDDFGTGNASFHYLRHLPVDHLKLDRSFMRAITENSFDASIVRGILVMARELGIDVVAEGVETEDQERLLRRLGCPLGQGYRYGRPRPVPTAETFGLGPPTALRAYPVPANEAMRVSLLHDARVLDTPPEPLFDALASRAADLCGTPRAFVALMDSDRMWNKAAYGATAGGSIPREIAVCSWTICSPSVLVVEDLLADSRFTGNTFVESEGGLRFYAGAPLVASTGTAFGTLCVFDHEPRVLSTEQIDGLAVIATQVTALLELRARLHQLDAAHKARDRAEATLSMATHGAQALPRPPRRRVGDV